MYDDFLSENELEEAKQEYDMIQQEQQEKWRKSAENACRLAGVTPPKVSIVNGKAGPRQIERELSLPLVGRDVRAVPNGFLRSALFGAVQPGRKKYLENVKINSVAGVDILYTGSQLNQNDLDVWEECIHLAKEYKLEDLVTFDGNKFLKKIGRKTGGAQHKFLKDTFKRLMGCVVEITDGDSYYLGSLLNKGAYDSKNNTYYIVVNKEIARIYGINTWSGLQLEERLKLKNKYLAKWLHGFYSTHKKPFKYKVGTLYELCGSSAIEVRYFRRDLTSALKKLEQVTGWQCAIIDGDLVEIKKT
jgi:hypothetical protein